MSVKISETAGDNSASPLLSEGDPPPFEIINPNGKAKCLIICDHAGVAIPKKLCGLGLEDWRLNEHYAQDVGARPLSEKTSMLLDAPCILANFSRLVIDVNRRLDHPTAFVSNTEHGPVPGNVNLSEADKAPRINEIYIPYHKAVNELLQSFAARDIVPAVVSIHTFTSQFYNQTRPWEIALLWVQDPRLPVPMIEYFRKKGFTVGDNEPYDARILRGSTLNHHADANLLPNALIEVWNGLLRSDRDCDRWGGMIADCLKGILADKSIHAFYDGPQFIHEQEDDTSYFDELIKKARKGEL